VKKEDFSKGLARNAAQLKSSINFNGKRLRSIDDEGDSSDKNESVAKMFSIVTDSSVWYILQCTVDTKVGSNPFFQLFRLPCTLNMDADKWKDDALKIYSWLIWFMNNMVSYTLPYLIVLTRKKRNKNAKKNDKSENTTRHIFSLLLN
jgi:hypothetical protein